MGIKNLTVVEEYLWWIANYTDDNGNLDLSFRYSRAMSMTRISLARYDIGFILSVAEQTATGRQLTDKQFELVKRLILKYARQFKFYGIDVPSESLLVSKNGIRLLNRSQEIWIDDNDVMCARFPFISDMVDDFREEAHSGCGSIKWDAHDKVWKLSVTESNVNWIVSYGNANAFKIDEKILKLFDRILDVEKAGYAIELIKDANGKYYVSNAAKSMQEYLEPIGQNLFKLMDYAGICGYSISNALIDELKIYDRQVTNNFITLCKTNTVAANPTDCPITVLLTWAKKVDRIPIVILDPLASNDTDLYKSLLLQFDESEIQVINIPLSGKGSRSSKDLTPGAKIIYTNYMLTNVHAKLLISLVSIIHGARKQAWFARFEKIVYFEYIKGYQ